MTVASVARDLLVTAIDLTRACSANELYLRWLALHSTGSAEIANYLSDAAIAFHEQAQPPTAFDPFAARENFSDILMASAPLSCEDLRAAVSVAIREAQDDSLLFPSSSGDAGRIAGTKGEAAR